MSLRYNQREELRDMLIEAFQYDLEALYPEDTVHEIVDSWLPVYDHDILQEWLWADCPEPEELSTLGDARNIHHAMQLGLYELGWAYAHELIGNARTHGEALENINERHEVTA